MRRTTERHRALVGAEAALLLLAFGYDPGLDDHHAIGHPSVRHPLSRLPRDHPSRRYLDDD
ncbi:hypothetical protein, partial [Streptomyces sp. WAC07061]|uniref:hypothetical protein n=1 Tax=Streptomyces sp. WAC07061 TaxID=2487410 RepID=UPI001C8E72DE